MLSRDKRLFFLRWLSNPWKVGVPVPSSRALAHAMAAQLSLYTADEYIVELGPGTGVVTRALCQAGIRQQRLVVVERDAVFLAKLKHDFPQALVLYGDACDLQSILLKHNIRQVAAIVSSLPLLSMPAKIRQAIIHAAFKVLKPEGVYIQYTYGLLSPVPVPVQRAVGIRGKVTKRIWGNFPPARIWRYTAELPA